MFSVQVLKENAGIEKYINVFHLLQPFLLAVKWKTIYLPFKTFSYNLVTPRLNNAFLMAPTTLIPYDSPGGPHILSWTVWC